MGKVCWINGQPYLVSLPRGGRDENDHNNQWDDLINFLGDDCNDIFHYKDMFSWCQESVGLSTYAVRGYNSARYWNCGNTSSESAGIGFRPVFTPLDSTTLKPDSSLLEGITDGSRFALASLYMDGKVIAKPQNPTDDGDIAGYIHGTDITLMDRTLDSKNWLHVIKFKDLLWADRNILTSISWDQLKNLGFAGEGKGPELTAPAFHFRKLGNSLPF